MSNTGDISLFVDVMIVETVLADPKFYKKGGEIGDVIGKIKNYFSSKYDPEHPNASVINELAPGAIWALFQTMGFGKWGIVAGLLMSTFHVDVNGLLGSIYNKVKEAISGGNKLSSPEVDQMVQSSVAAHAGSEADDGITTHSSLDLLHDARIIRLALVEYERQLLRLTKEASIPLISLGAVTKSGGTRLLGLIFGLIIKIALASAGFMGAGDAINHVLGRPSSLDGTYQAGKTEEATPAPASGGTPAPVSTQKKFPFKSDGPLPRVISMSNNSENIASMLVQFTKDVYSGLDGKDSIIENTPTFQVVKNNIVWYNSSHPNSTVTIIPPMFTSKKELVDYFIDDVAKQA